MTERLIDEPSVLLSSQPAGVSAAPATTCDCGHEAARHDPTALRYCRATASSELRRSCICDVALAQPMSRR
jgi:hypothetical protein